jgi:hypothetical protein
MPTEDEDFEEVLPIFPLVFLEVLKYVIRFTGFYMHRISFTRPFCCVDTIKGPSSRWPFKYPEGWFPRIFHFLKSVTG